MEAIASIGERVRSLGQSFSQQTRLAYEEGLITEEEFMNVARHEALRGGV
jgi:hypothetical protein